MINDCIQHILSSVRLYILPFIWTIGEFSHVVYDVYMCIVKLFQVVPVVIFL